MEVTNLPQRNLCQTKSMHVNSNALHAKRLSKASKASKAKALRAQCRWYLPSLAIPTPVMTHDDPTGINRIQLSFHARMRFNSVLLLHPFLQALNLGHQRHIMYWSSQVAQNITSLRGKHGKQPGNPHVCIEQGAFETQDQDSRLPGSTWSRASRHPLGLALQQEIFLEMQTAKIPSISSLLYPKPSTSVPCTPHQCNMGSIWYAFLQSGCKIQPVERL